MQRMDRQVECNSIKNKHSGIPPLPKRFSMAAIITSTMFVNVSIWRGTSSSPLSPPHDGVRPIQTPPHSRVGQTPRTARQASKPHAWLGYVLILNTDEWVESCAIPYLEILNPRINFISPTYSTKPYGIGPPQIRRESANVTLSL